MQFHPTAFDNFGVPAIGEVHVSNQDVLKVKYTDPLGKDHTLIISTSHRVMVVEHEETNACLLIRPSGMQFLEGTK
jgi:hypothetical protein